MKNRKPGLPYKGELYRLWFEYLRLAHTYSKLNSGIADKVRLAVRASADFYAPWGNIDDIRFDAWWKDHRHLFLDEHLVRRLAPGEQSSDPSLLVIQVPLTLSPTEATRQVGSIIQLAFAASQRASKKSKRRAQSIYHPTEESEPKLRAVRDSLTVYRDVHLKYPTLKGQKLLDAVRQHFKTNRKKKHDIPMALWENAYETEARAQRNLLRYIKRAETIMLNVARGAFPGRYQS